MFKQNPNLTVKFILTIVLILLIILLLNIDSINAKAKGDWSLGSLIALKEYIDDMLNSIKKKVKDENRRK